jgi:hypothetical protein
MYERVAKKKNNLFFTLWYLGAILLAEKWCVGERKMADPSFTLHVARFF